MKFDIEETIKNIKKPWDPIDLVKFDNKILRVALFEGKYKEHSHDNFEETFIVYKGKITIFVDGRPNELLEGQGVKVPKGAKHRVVASIPSYILFVDED